VASVSRLVPARAPGGERRYVASLLWRGAPSRPANDNHCGISVHRLVSLAASLLLLAATVWALAL
jgi:hypothetical protein